eukprot:1186424-Prorocentrum_minimum.AAC.3
MRCSERRTLNPKRETQPPGGIKALTGPPPRASTSGARRRAGRPTAPVETLTKQINTMPYQHRFAFVLRVPPCANDEYQAVQRENPGRTSA